MIMDEDRDKEGRLTDERECKETRRHREVVSSEVGGDVGIRPLEGLRPLEGT